MGAVSISNFTIKLNDMREEIQNKKANCCIVKNKVYLKIILWWAGTFLGKSLRDIMNKSLTAANLDREQSRLAKPVTEVRYLLAH